MSTEMDRQTDRHFHRSSLHSYRGRGNELDDVCVCSELKGCSLYERLHLTAEKLPLRSRVSIGRQVAQALGYLHAKSISARCLSSRNVYLEPKVKLSVLDHAIADTNCAR